MVTINVGPLQQRLSYQKHKIVETTHASGTRPNSLANLLFSHHILKSFNDSFISLYFDLFTYFFFFKAYIFKASHKFEKKIPNTI